MNRQLALAIQLNDEATLSDFCWGNNSLLKEQLTNTLLGSGEKFLSLWGNEGSGKSHLLQACCQALSPPLKAIYLPLRILKEWGPQCLEGLEEQTLIALDDVDCIAGDSQWEEALFHFYNKIRDKEQTILILSATDSPSSLKIQLPDLQSRIGWGLTLKIHDLSDELKIKTIQHHAKKRGFEISSLVGQFLIKRCSRNMRDLHSILDQLDTASLAAKRKITVPFVKSILNL